MDWLAARKMSFSFTEISNDHMQEKLNNTFQPLKFYDGTAYNDSLYLSLSFA